MGTFTVHMEVLGIEYFSVCLEVLGDVLGCAWNIYSLSGNTGNILRLP
jgi:hypothetical protein